MSAARAAKELAGGTGVTWAQETDRRLKQALGVSQADTRTTAQLWDAYLTKKGYKFGTATQKVTEWLKAQNEPTLTYTYAALRLMPYHLG